jgi:hypothetical protein
MFLAPLALTVLVVIALVAIVGFLIDRSVDGGDR